MSQIVYLISRDYSGYRTVYDTFSSYDLDENKEVMDYFKNI